MWRVDILAVSLLTFSAWEQRHICLYRSGPQRREGMPLAEFLVLKLPEAQTKLWILKQSFEHKKLAPFSSEKFPKK